MTRTAVRTGLLALAFAAAPLASAGAQRQRDSWFGADKAKHFLVSFFVQSAGYAALRTGDAPHGRALAAASLGTAAVAIWKERVDRRRTGLFSVRDLAWDAAGGLAATALLRHAER